MRIKVEDTNLSARIINALMYNEILYIDEINSIRRYVFKNQLRNIGEKSYKELSDYLEKNNIEWH